MKHRIEHQINHCFWRLSYIKNELNRGKSWEWNRKSLIVDPYSCVIKTKCNYFIGWKTVGHFPREISQDVRVFYQKRRGLSFLKFETIKYQSVSISFKWSGSSAVAQIWLLKRKTKWVTIIMESFLENWCTYDFDGHLELILTLQLGNNWYIFLTWAVIGGNHL